jgi:hypothetical protein
MDSTRTDIRLVPDAPEEHGGESLLQLLRLDGWQVQVSANGAEATRGDATLRIKASSRPEAVMRVFEAAIAARGTDAARAA